MFKNIVIAVALIIGALVFLRGATGEDTWMCQNGTWVAHGKPSAPKPTTGCGNSVQSKKTNNMQLTSSAFADGEMIPSVFSCDGKGIHPPFTVSEVPTGTKSMAIVLDDPDAPAGTFTHWVVWNIPADGTTIGEGLVPEGAVEGTNSAGKVGYFPPCPPTGTHHYIFTLFALDSPLTLLQKTTKAELEATMSGHIITQTTLTGLYTRQNK